MALKRTFLKGLGLNDEQIEAVIEAHAETVDGLKTDLSKYKGDAEKLPNVQKELDELKAKGDDGWKEKHDKLKSEFNAYKKDIEAKESRAAKETAYRAILKDANLSERGVEKAIKYADWEKIELEEDGKLKGAADHLKNVKEDWAEYVDTTISSGAKTNTPPATGGSGSMTRDEINKIKDPVKRQQAIAENISLYRKDN